MDVGMFQGKKILVTGGGGYFGHKLGNELKKMGAVVVLFDISRPLDEVVNEQMECLQVDLAGKLRYLLWIILPKQLHSDLAFVLRTDESIKFYQRENTWKLFQFAVSDTRWREVLSKDSRILL